MSALVIVAAAIVAVLIASPVPRVGVAARGAARRPGPALARAAVGLGVLVVLAGAVQGTWAMKKWVDRGGGGRDLDSRTALDRVLGGRHVGMWMPPAPLLSANPEWEELRYFTPSVRDGYLLGPSQTAPRFEGDEWRRVRVDRETGRIIPLAAGVQLPTLMATVAGQRTAPLRGRVVATEPELGIEVVRVNRPASVRWVSGPTLDGRLGSGTAETVRVFPPFPAGSCLRVQLVGNGRGTVRFRSDGREVAVRPGESAALHVRLSGNAARTVRVSVRGPAEQLPDGRRLTGRVLADDVVKCPRAGA